MTNSALKLLTHHFSFGTAHALRFGVNVYNSYWILEWGDDGWRHTNNIRDIFLFFLYFSAKWLALYWFWAQNNNMLIRRDFVTFNVLDSKALQDCFANVFIFKKYHQILSISSKNDYSKFHKWKCPNGDEKIDCLNVWYGIHEASISIKTFTNIHWHWFETIELTESHQQFNVPVETSELPIT